MIIDSNNSTVILSITPSKSWITIEAPLNNATTYTMSLAPPLKDFSNVGYNNFSVILTNSQEISFNYSLSIFVENTEPYFETSIQSVMPTNPFVVLVNG